MLGQVLWVATFKGFLVGFLGFKQIYIRIFIKRGKWVSISCFLENQPNQIGIKLVIAPIL